MNMTDQEKTAELLNLMDSLCDEKFTKDNSNLDAWINKLNRIYANEYRHSYSDIFFKLQQIISQEPKSEVLEILGENLNVLGNRINEMASINSEDANYANTASGYKKFADHIRLEIGRYNILPSRF